MSDEEIRDALRHALSILKQIDFSSIPNINYDEIPWDWLRAACDEGDHVEDDDDGIPSEAYAYEERAMYGDD